MVQSFAEETLAHALAVLGDAGRDEEDRENAACVAQVLLRRMQPSEAVIVDAFDAVSRSLDVYLAPRWVLGALASMRAPAVEKLASGIDRLLEREFVARRFENLADVLLVVLDEPIWAVRVREQWIHAAVADPLDRLPESKTTVALLIGGWILAHGDALGWIADLVEERPTLVTTGLLPVSTRWQLHRVRPTVAGWRALSIARGPSPALDAEYFGAQTDVARESLMQALAEAPDESSKLTLARWLVALVEGGT